MAIHGERVSHCIWCPQVPIMSWSGGWLHGCRGETLVLGVAGGKISLFCTCPGCMFCGLGLLSLKSNSVSNQIGQDHFELVLHLLSSPTTLQGEGRCPVPGRKVCIYCPQVRQRPGSCLHPSQMKENKPVSGN